MRAHERRLGTLRRFDARVALWLDSTRQSHMPPLLSFTFDPSSYSPVAHSAHPPTIPRSHRIGVSSPPLQLGIIKPPRGTTRESPERYITAAVLCAVPALQAAPPDVQLQLRPVFFSFSFRFPGFSRSSKHQREKAR